MTAQRMSQADNQALHWSVATYFADETIMDRFAPFDDPGTLTYQACRDVLRILAYLTCQARPGRIDGLPPGAVLVRALDPTAPEHIVTELLRCGHTLDSGTDDPVVAAWTWLQDHEQHDLADAPAPMLDPESNYERGRRTSVELLDRVLLHQQGGWPVGTPIRVRGGQHDGDVGGVLSPVWAIADPADDPWNVTKTPPAAYRVWLVNAATETELAPADFSHRADLPMPGPVRWWEDLPASGAVDPDE